MTKDYTPLGPDVVEQKYYARGVGFVLAVHIKGPGARIERVKVEQLAPSPRATVASENTSEIRFGRPAAP